MLSYLNRRNFIRYGMTSAAASTIISPLPLFAQSTKQSFITKEIAQGRLRGIREEGVNIFRGIPYATGVSGEQRFSAPSPMRPWAGVRDALTLGHPSIQILNRGINIFDPDPGEDCLVLNVWTPANDNKKRPVMFYCHGGGFSTGSGGSVPQDGANLARYYNVVVVQTNHRLGLLGYLYLDELGGEEYAGSGNRGMQDIVAGLQWVNDNITEFGGDPDNVMVCGESGGGGKISCIYAMPDAAELFQKASIESGPGITMGTPEIAQQTTELLLSELGISLANWRKIMDIPADKLLQAQLSLPAIAGGTGLSGGFSGLGFSGIGSFGPVVDGHILPTHPFKPKAPDISKDKPLLVGWNEDEFAFFLMFGGDTSVIGMDESRLIRLLREKYHDNAEQILQTYKQSRPDASPTELYIAISSLNLMGLGSIRIAERKLQQNAAPVYLYNFAYKSEMTIPGTNYPIGTPHAMDITFKFFNVQDAVDKSGKGIGMSGNRPERLQASRNFSEFWTSFAKTSSPSATGQEVWPAYSLDSRATMRISENCEVIEHRFNDEIEMWASLEET